MRAIDGGQMSCPAQARGPRLARPAQPDLHDGLGGARPQAAPTAQTGPNKTRAVLGRPEGMIAHRASP